VNSKRTCRGGATTTEKCPVRERVGAVLLQDDGEGREEQPKEAAVQVKGGRVRRRRIRLTQTQDAAYSGSIRIVRPRAGGELKFR
jgi:hypothetical protein